MKFTKSIALLFSMLLGSVEFLQTSVVREIEYKNKLPITVDNLTRQSYISPTMQWAVLSLFDKPAFFEIDKNLGIVENIPTVKELLTAIELQLFKGPNKAQLEVLHDGLNMMLQATEIAHSFVEIKLAHKDELFMPLKNMLLQELEHQKIAIHKLHEQLHKRQHFDKLSYFSWIWKNRFFVKKPVAILQEVHFDESLSTIKIPAHCMQAIMQNTDYLQHNPIVCAANILCKECLIAQQPYNGQITVLLNARSPLSTTDYILDHLPNMYNPYVNSYPLCEYIQGLDQDVNMHLVYLRQAIQMAISIVHKQLAIHERYVVHFPKVINLHALLDELKKYDTHVAALCAGLPVDTPQLPMAWSFTTKLTIATIITVLGGKILYDYVRNIDVIQLPEKDVSLEQLQQAGEPETSTQIVDSDQDNDSLFKFAKNFEGEARHQLQRFYQYIYPQKKGKGGYDEQLNQVVEKEQDWGAAYEQSAREDEEDKNARQLARGNSERTGFLRYIFGPGGNDNDECDKDSDKSEEIPPLELIPEVQQKLKELAHQAAQAGKEKQDRKQAESAVQDVNTWTISQSQSKPPLSEGKEKKDIPPVRYIGEMQKSDKGLETSSYISSEGQTPDDAQAEEQDEKFDSYWFKQGCGKLHFERMENLEDLSLTEAIDEQLSIDTTTSSAQDTQPIRSSIKKLLEEKIVQKEVQRVEADIQKQAQQLQDQIEAQTPEIQLQEESVYVIDKTKKNQPSEVQFTPKSEYTSNQTSPENMQETGLRQRRISFSLPEEEASEQDKTL